MLVQTKCIYKNNPTNQFAIFNMPPPTCLTFDSPWKLLFNRINLKWNKNEYNNRTIETSARPLFPQWSHHVYPQFLPGSHPNYQNATNIHHNHSNNSNMPRISTPSTPTTTSTTNLSQTILNSSKAQPNHHLHNHYHYPLHHQNNSHHQQPQPIHRNHSHLNGATSSHIRNRNNNNASHKTIALNNNNYQFRTDSGIFLCIWTTNLCSTHTINDFTAFFSYKQIFRLLIFHFTLSLTV